VTDGTRMTPLRGLDEELKARIIARLDAEGTRSHIVAPKLWQLYAAHGLAALRSRPAGRIANQSQAAASPGGRTVRRCAASVAARSPQTQTRTACHFTVAA
jgi:hypothetical protein